jgi:hypothetical protein
MWLNPVQHLTLFGHNWMQSNTGTYLIWLILILSSLGQVCVLPLSLHATNFYGRLTCPDPTARCPPHCLCHLINLTTFVKTHKLWISFLSFSSLLSLWSKFSPSIMLNMHIQQRRIPQLVSLHFSLGVFRQETERWLLWNLCYGGQIILEFNLFYHITEYKNTGAAMHMISLTPKQ